MRPVIRPRRSHLPIREACLVSPQQHFMFASQPEESGKIRLATLVEGRKNDPRLGYSCPKDRVKMARNAHECRVYPLGSIDDTTIVIVRDGADH